MKLHSRTKSSITLVTLCAIAFVLSIGALRIKADEHDKRTILTIDQPIQVTDTLLEPGRYVFKLAESSANRHIVQIFNGDETRIINTVLAIPNYRLQPTGDSRFMFWETPSGSARALRAWFYPGDNTGQEFPYPKQLAMLHTSEHTLIQAPPPAPAAQLPEPTAIEPPPSPEPSPQSSLQPLTQEEPNLLAQNTSPPPPPEAQSAPKEEPLPDKLPSTASPYPLIGLGGLFSLGLCGLLRLKRSV